MQHELIGYLLQALEDDETAHVEHVLTTCVETQQQLEILARGLEPVSALGADVVVPVGLSVRTCQTIRAVVGKTQPVEPKPDPPPDK
jgi:hypothetical protein